MRAFAGSPRSRTWRRWYEQRDGYEQDDRALMSKQLWNVWPLMVTSDVILWKSNASCSLTADVDAPMTLLVTTTSSNV